MSDLRLSVNGEPLTLAAGCTVADVVTQLLGGTHGKGIAVAVDRTVVPRSEWATTALRADAQVEVVTAAAGG